jgi:peptide/nickel transport system ATP-binding protein
MYAGRLAEVGETRTVLGDAAHPYTLGLMRSRLSLDTDRSKPLVALAGDVPSPAAPHPGCAFSPRCEFAVADCESRPPPLVEIASRHSSACILDKADRSARTAAISGESVAEPIGTPSKTADRALLAMRGITKSFAVGLGLGQSGRLHALRGVALTVHAGESVALVGESGSGKSTLLRIAAGLESRDAGEMALDSPVRPQMVFQDSGASLTPWMTVEELIGERVRSLGRKQRAGKVVEALSLVGLPAEVAKAKSAQLSGGQRQRVCLARATVVPPPILLCDEPTSALDVSLAASVLNLIARLRRELGMSVLFVTHDLSVARIIADRIAVIYLGRIVEIGPADQVIAEPVHPYTKALLSAVPDLDREPLRLAGEPASAMRPPTGCAFHPRCPQRTEYCSQDELDVRLTAVRKHELHLVACINPQPAEVA